MTHGERLNRDHPSGPVSDRYRDRPMTAQDVFAIAIRDAVPGSLVMRVPGKYRKTRVETLGEAWLKLQEGTTFSHGDLLPAMEPYFAFDKDLRIYWPDATGTVEFVGGGRSALLRPDGSTLMQHYGLESPHPDSLTAAQEATERALAPPSYPEA